MAKKKVAVLQVHSKRPGFRRAGYQFGTDPVNIPLTELKKDQRAAIEAEPMLVAVETEVEAEEAAA